MSTGYRSPPPDLAPLVWFLTSPQSQVATQMAILAFLVWLHISGGLFPIQQAGRPSVCWCQEIKEWGVGQGRPWDVCCGPQTLSPRACSLHLAQRVGNGNFKALIWGGVIGWLVFLPSTPLSFHYVVLMVFGEQRILRCQKNKMPDKKIWGSSARAWSREEVPRTSNLHGGDHSSKGQGSLGGA